MNEVLMKSSSRLTVYIDITYSKGDDTDIDSKVNILTKPESSVCFRAVVIIFLFVCLLGDVSYQRFEILGVCAVAGL
jgi:hypothetical protein